MTRVKLSTVGALLLLALVAGSWLVRRGIASPRPGGRISAADGQRLLDAVMRRVQQSWVDSASTDELYRHAALGMIEELGDPNTTFLPPDRLRRLREVTSGSYTGVGISVDSRDGWVVAILVRPGLPADRAGIQVGDRLVEVNGQSMKGWTVEEARNALRGPLGSTFKLAIERRFGGARVEFTLARSDIHVSSVGRAMLLADGVGYFAIASFTDSTALEVSATVDSLVKAGAHSLVMDLRGNPGGLLSQGVAVADLFLETGQRIVSTKGRVATANATFVDKAPQQWPKLPIVAIVNGNTASAAEIVAGALQDHDRAVVLGRPSYGKGSAQAVIPLDSGAAIKVTNALWYTPAGRSIDRPHLHRADAPVPDTTRPKYKTDRGRVVQGGGGIVPDVITGDSTVPVAERRWVEAVGARVQPFRDVLSAYARQLAHSGAVKDPEFAVTADMRDGLWKAMVARKLVVSRDIFDDAHEAIDRVLGAEVAVQQFGTVGLQRRVVRSDAVISGAAKLLRGVAEPSALFDRVARSAASPAAQGTRHHEH